VIDFACFVRRAYSFLSASAGSAATALGMGPFAGPPGFVPFEDGPTTIPLRFRAHGRRFAIVPDGEVWSSVACDVAIRSGHLLDFPASVPVAQVLADVIEADAEVERAV
jgi:hypothetical protein